jgi:ABC-type transporter Mla maintaining outer membrane lipid asymmetry ATPase subunit MlaF
MREAHFAIIGNSGLGKAILNRIIKADTGMKAGAQSRLFVFRLGKDKFQ